MRRRIFCSIILLFAMQMAMAQSGSKQAAGKQPVTTSTTNKPAGPTGRFELYSGIPTIYLGHVILQSDGKYKVAFSNAETDYETGTYAYHADTDTIEWLTGLFKNKNWQGKLLKKSGGYRIEFNKTTFAEN